MAMRAIDRHEGTTRMGQTALTLAARADKHLLGLRVEEAGEGHRHSLGPRLPQAQLWVGDGCVFKC